MSLLVDASVWSLAFRRDVDAPTQFVEVLRRALAALAFLQPDRQDHIEAAAIRNTCRRNGVQISTIDALLIQLCVRHDLVLLSADYDFRSDSKHVRFRLWGGDA